MWSRRSFQCPASVTRWRHMSPSRLAVPHRSTDGSPKQSANFIQKKKKKEINLLWRRPAIAASASRLRARPVSLISRLVHVAMELLPCSAEVMGKKKNPAQLGCAAPSRSGGDVKTYPKILQDGPECWETRVRSGVRIWPFLLSSPMTHLQ